jgi:hypothetical protein
MSGQPEPWGTTGRAVIVTGLAYPVLLGIVGIVYIAVTRPLAQSALIFGVPVVIVVVAALVWDPNRGPRRAAARERQAIATERGWQFIADGTDVLGDRWATGGERPQVTATSVLAGDIDGWPVTICDSVARGRGRVPDTRTVTCLVHLPVSLPHTVALPAYDLVFNTGLTDGRPWTAPEYLGEPTAEKLYLASSDHSFGDRLGSPEIRGATVDRNLMFWRIKGRDLSISRLAQGRRIPTEQTLRIASDLIALARALPPDLVSTYGKPPQQDLPFRASAPNGGPADAPPT